MIIILIVFIAIALVLSFSTSVVELSEDTTSLKQIESGLRRLDSFITETAKEGTGATRTARLDFTGNILAIPEEDTFQYETTTASPIIESFSRILSGNIITVSGNDVSCRKQTNLVMENTFLRAEFQNIERTTPMSSIDTTNNIKFLKEKTLNTQITLLNSSIVIDENASTSAGTGYSEILVQGTSLPACTVHFFINSSAAVYDAYYILYAGADFLVMDVRNVR